MNHIYSYRAIEPGDVEFIFNLINETSNIHMIPRILIGCSQHRLRHYVTSEMLNSDQHRWLILENNHEKLGIGVIHDYNPKDKNVQVYWILGDISSINDDDLRASTRELLRVCFSDLNVHRIQMQCYEFEEKLIRIFELLNAHRDAALKDDYFVYNRFWDKYIYSVLFPEWT